MSWITSCPACMQWFHVEPSQLQVRQGKVRCGHCHQVFDASLRLYPQPEPAFDSMQAVSDVSSNVNLSADLNLSAAASQRSPILTSLHAHLPPYFYSFCALLLLCLFFGQLAYFLRAPIAAHWPESKPLLVSMCSMIGCNVPHVSDIRQLAILDSELQQDSQRDGVVYLHATIANRANHVQPYPMLELTLTDEQDRVLSKTSFTPTQYLSSASMETSVMMEKGMSAASQFRIELPLLINAQLASGYRALLFYP